MADNEQAFGSWSADRAVTWAIVGGADETRFSIDQNGALSLTAPQTAASPNDADGNSIYEVVIQATDANNYASTQTIYATVGSSDTTAPVLTGPDGQTGATAAVTVAENTTAVSAYAADESVTWSLAGADAAKFEIGTDGSLAFKAAPDFEARASAAGDNAYKATVIGTDAAGDDSRQDLTVNVSDVDETLPLAAGGPVSLRAGGRDGVSGLDGLLQAARIDGRSARSDELNFALRDGAAHVLVLRGEWSFAENWDLLLEHRTLYEPGSGAVDQGFLAAPYYRVSDNARIGAGYDFGSLSSDLTETEHQSGVFVNAIWSF